ncbi:MAG: hypothetical protein M1837_006463 [Sclerophora amabilis]|nr:MAG: hypothetical protein M1837_006463 [Sclerophora amabilis]
MARRNTFAVGKELARWVCVGRDFVARSQSGNQLPWTNIFEVSEDPANVQERVVDVYFQEGGELERARSRRRSVDRTKDSVLPKIARIVMKGTGPARSGHWIAAQTTTATNQELLMLRAQRTKDKQATDSKIQGGSNRRLEGSKQRPSLVGAGQGPCQPAREVGAEMLSDDGLEAEERRLEQREARLRFPAERTGQRGGEESKQLEVGLDALASGLTVIMSDPRMTICCVAR